MYFRSYSGFLLAIGVGLALLSLPRFNSAISLALPVAPAAPAVPAYHQVAKITLGGEGGWDYLKVDSAASVCMSRAEPTSW